MWRRMSLKEKEYGGEGVWRIVNVEERECGGERVWKRGSLEVSEYGKGQNVIFINNLILIILFID